jgi:5'-3' exonuclease
VEVGATVALGRSLKALQKSSKFTHFAVAFDTVIESFRNQLFDGYKTGEGIDATLFAQFPLAERITGALGFAVLSMIEFEADDGLATLAAQMLQRDDVAEVVIASPDKDLMQCVRPGVVTWDRMRDRIYDEAGVEAKMGVGPELIPDYLALVGDTADGIPGVPRWGARSAATALSHFGHLEQIPRDPSVWDIKLRGLPALLQNLRERETEVLLYRTLATLRTDAPLGVTFEEMEFRGPDEVALGALGEELGVSLGG